MYDLISDYGSELVLIVAMVVLKLFGKEKSAEKIKAKLERRKAKRKAKLEKKLAKDSTKLEKDLCELEKLNE